MWSRTVGLCFYLGKGVLVRLEAHEVGECEIKAVIVPQIIHIGLLAPKDLVTLESV